MAVWQYPKDEQDSQVDDIPEKVRGLWARAIKESFLEEASIPLMGC